MRIRTQLIAVVVVSLAVGLAALAMVLAAATESNQAGDAQHKAQTVGHEVAGLLALTQEYARHAEPRAAQQWRQRHGTIASALHDEVHVRLTSVALVELRSVVGALPPLFARLEDLPMSDDAFTRRRKEVLLDQLLTSTQATNDYAYQWFQDATAVKREAEQRFQLIALTVPALLLVLLAATAVWVRKRVLLPMEKLDLAAAAVGGGDMTHRIANNARDEIGDLSRQFDRMTAALADSAEHLRHSEQQLRAVTDNLPALIAYVNHEHHFEFANDKYRDWLGLNPAAMIGQPVREVLGPDAYEAVRHNLDRALVGERVQWAGSNLREGCESHYLAEYIPDVAADGTVRGCYALTLDITERREAEMRIARSEERLLDLMNNIPAMVGYFDMHEHCLYANDTGLKSLGLDRAEVPGLPLHAALGHANYTQHQPYVREVLQGRRARFQGKMPFKGRSSHFQAHLIPDRLEGGAQRGFYLMTFDITALKEAQLEQARVEGRLRDITDNLPVLISYIDQDERYRFVNQTLKDWLGVEPAQAIGRLACEVGTPELYTQRRDALRRALAGERVSFEVESVTLGVTRHLHNTYIPDIQSDGSVAGLYALSTDVSALKKVEHQLSLLVRADTLTGLANRYQFNETFPTALGRAARNRTGLALMFLDVDRFKTINDTHGHAVGDAVLSEFATRLRLSVRTTDLVARFAGDEFVVLLEGLHDVGESQLIARKVIAQMERPFTPDDAQGNGLVLHVTTSVGVAYHASEQGQTTTTRLLALADKALYEAKRDGRNTFRMAEEVAS